jgi:hypothetical protein
VVSVFKYLATLFIRVHLNKSQESPMTVKPRPPRPSSQKATVLRLVPTINKPLNADGSEVARKLKKALTTAQSGATAGALIIAIDQTGEWDVDLAGQLVRDRDTLCLIACRILGACLAHSQVCETD